MISVSEIIITLIILLFASFGVGSFYNEKSAMYQTTLGFLAILCIMQIVIPFITLLRINTAFAYVVFIIVLICGIILGMFNLKRFKISIKGILITMGCIGVVSLIAYSYSQQNLGINTFDTVHYLSFVNEVSSANVFGKVNFATGSDMQVFYHAYDFQSFYYLFGMITC